MNRLRRVGLTNRLVGLVVGLLVLSCLVVGVATTLALRSFLTRRLDQQLAAAGVRYSVSLEHPGAGDADSDDATFDSTVGQAAGTLGARLFDGKVTAIGVIDPGPQHPRPNSADRAVLQRLSISSHPRTVSLPRLGDYRLAVARGRDGDVLITGLPMREVDDPVQHLIAAEGIAFVLAILVAALIGIGVIRRGLGPLTRIAATARGVSNLPLASGSVTLPDAIANPRPGTEVGDVIEAFNRMLEHVQGALAQRHSDDERLRHFVADASHELRTPVAVIGSYAEFAQRERDDDPVAVDHALARIRAESARMGRLVDDLLQLAQLDLGRPMTLADVDLTRVVLDAVTDAARLAPSHGWQLDLPEHPVIVRGDGHTLHQAVASLLANARVHTAAGTTVTVTVERVPGRVRLAVHDNGAGIPASVLPHVVERFTRADESRARADGAGLGLAICDAIVRAHGGTLTILSQPGDTSFVIELPDPPEPSAEQKR